MISVTRLLSVRSHGRAIGMMVIFASGLAAGAALGPVNASRGGADELSVPRRQQAALPSALRFGHPAEVLRVLDGDTFEARVLLWPGLEITTKVRLRGIDTPELKGRCEEERLKAAAARDALTAILAQGDVGISAVALDKYGGRVIADASTRATPDIAAALLGAGLARNYTGARREPWCS
jgi:micrococcal nuclease